MKTVLLVLLLSPCLVWAQVFKITPQDTERKQSYLIMRDGTVMRGQVIRQDSTIISVRRRNGDMSFVEADQVLSITGERPMSSATTVSAQTSTPSTVFVMKDGARVEGTFVKRDSTMITVRRRNGQLTFFEPELLARVDTVRMETFTASSQGFTNRFSPWLLSGLTAYNAEKGRFYYRNTWLLLNEFDYGITSFWSVGARFIAPIPYLVYADTYYGTGQYWESASRLFTKLSVPLGQSFRLGINAMYQANQRYMYTNSRGTWTLQALATIGSSQRNVTVGYGIAVPRAKLQTGFGPGGGLYTRFDNQTFLSLGIMQKVSRGLTLLSDNRFNLGDQYSIYNEERVSASFALRIDRRRHAFDLGVFGLIYKRPMLYDNKSVRFFPYLGYNLIIGRD
ncbi:hypothetical protein ACFSUS_26020 [Spirosoma soli]|uniref:DUF481 domain-containing protein n=1 Tax=Spirosoma soli TaxID=1770529 RepID=A0ABW5MAN2_9BACT